MSDLGSSPCLCLSPSLVSNALLPPPPLRFSPSLRGQGLLQVWRDILMGEDLGRSAWIVLLLSM